MVRGPASSGRLLAAPDGEPKVRYLAKGTGLDHGNALEAIFHQDFDYLEWIARLTSHIPEKGTQLVHYYGAYSNAHRGKALRCEAFTLPNPEGPLPQTDPTSPWLKERRRSWARLIRKVYEADPLLCRCGGRMRVVGFITQASVIRMILDHVGRVFDPLRLPALVGRLSTGFEREGVRAPPPVDDFSHDPFPDYGPQ
jgi:hypothetical protein